MTFLPHQRNSAIKPEPAFHGAGPTAIGRFVAPVAGKTLSRGGPAMASLLGQWATIAGPALAAHTLPAKLTKAAQAPALSGKSAPSMLLLKVDPAKALDVQYAIPQLIERVNQTLGYQAIAGVRLIQAPVAHGVKKRPPATASAPRAVDKESRLGNAFARMAAGLRERGQAS